MILYISQNFREGHPKNSLRDSLAGGQSRHTRRRSLRDSLGVGGILSGILSGARCKILRSRWHFGHFGILGAGTLRGIPWLGVGIPGRLGEMADPGKETAE